MINVYGLGVVLLDRGDLRSSIPSWIGTPKAAPGLGDLVFERDRDLLRKLG